MHPKDLSLAGRPVLLSGVCLRHVHFCRTESALTSLSPYFSFPFPEGGTAQFTYVADENGYRPQSPLIPTPHPLPAHAIEQIRFAESQRNRFG